MFASEQYRESWEASSKWIDERAPDFVKECIEEIHRYIFYLREHLDARDKLIREICVSNGIDPKTVLKPYEGEDTNGDNG